VHSLALQTRSIDHPQCNGTEETNSIPSPWQDVAGRASRRRRIFLTRARGRHMTEIPRLSLFFSFLLFLLLVRGFSITPHLHIDEESALSLEFVKSTPTTVSGTVVIGETSSGEGQETRKASDAKKAIKNTTCCPTRRIINNTAHILIPCSFESSNFVRK
jgi:hypothetical protein